MASKLPENYSFIAIDVFEQHHIYRSIHSSIYIFPLAQLAYSLITPLRINRLQIAQRKQTTDLRFSFPVDLSISTF